MNVNDIEIKVPPLDGEGLGWGEPMRPAVPVETFTPTLPSPIRGEGDLR